VPTREKTLVLGCGNPARGDDGLGPALIERLERARPQQVETRVGYQLCVEDALDIGSFRQVIFVDASCSAKPPFEYYLLQEDKTQAELDTHGVSPEALMLLARTLFGAKTPAHILAIRGYEFEPFVETLSTEAEKNLDVAFRHLLEQLSGG
jgi:hydrogenase maturation protease